MIEWTDDAIVLSARPHGEGAAILQLLTRRHGRHAGLVRGGASRRMRGVLQPGNAVVAHWRARLAEHLGACTVELVQNRWAQWFDDPERLAGLDAICAVSEASLPEREPLEPVHEAATAFLDHLDAELWPALYVRWEIGLLGALGYGLDLSSCAVTGETDELVYVSPRSGRAVSRRGGEPYRDKLLPLPAFLLGKRAPTHADLLDGLELTGQLLRRHVLNPANRDLPPARLRLVDRIRHSSTISMHSDADQEVT